MAQRLTLVATAPGDLLRSIRADDYVPPASFINTAPGDSPQERREAFRIVNTEETDSGFDYPRL